MFEIGEDLGSGPCASVAWASSKYPSVFRVMAKYGSRVVFATNPDRGECRFRRVGACGVVVSREATCHRCVRLLRWSASPVLQGNPLKSLCVCECLHGRHSHVVGPHHDKPRGGVCREVSVRPINGGPTGRLWEAPRSDAFKAERRKPVVDRGELTQKTH